MPARKRIRRKDLKQPDEFISLSYRLWQWIQRHRREAIGAGSVLVALLLGITLTIAYRNARHRDANADFGRALAAVRAADWPTAASALSQVAERWAGTPVGRLAALLSADVELRQGNLDSAALLLQRLEPDLAALPPYLRQQFLYARGIILESKGDWEAAARAYGAAARLEGPYAGPATLAAARAQEHLGHADQARELYQAYYDHFPDLPDRALAEAKLNG